MKILDEYKDIFILFLKIEWFTYKAMFFEWNFDTDEEYEEEDSEIDIIYDEEYENTMKDNFEVDEITCDNFSIDDSLADFDGDNEELFKEIQKIGNNGGKIEKAKNKMKKSQRIRRRSI